MTDTHRSERPHQAADPSERERDARVEQLLIDGLDHYFAAEFDRAINVWTRVLFINHGHTRARAYIERARCAIAERQRESEELLQHGLDAVRRGDTTAARHLLTSAAQHGAERDETFAALTRLQRLESASAPRRTPPSKSARPSTVADPAANHTAHGRSRGWATALLVGAALFVLLVLGGAQIWLPSADVAAGAPVPVEPLPVPTRAELRMADAREQQASGHLREALKALDDVRRTDAAWGEAQALRALIQQQLLTGAGSPIPARPLDAEGPLRP